MANPYLNTPRIFQNYELPEEEDQGVLSYLGDLGLGALGTLGNIFDTPGSFVRGLLAGEPGRAFGGVFDPSQRVSGKELVGIEDDPDSWWDDVGGIGTEILTDPLTFFSSPLAYASKGAQVAAKAGLAPAAKGLGTKLFQGARELGASTTVRDLAATEEGARQLMQAAELSKPGWIKSVTSKITGERFGPELADDLVKQLNSPKGTSWVDEPLAPGLGRFSWGEKGINIGGVEAAKRMDQLGYGIRYGNWLSKVPGNTKPVDYANAPIVPGATLGGMPDLASMVDDVPAATVTRESLEKRLDDLLYSAGLQGTPEAYEAARRARQELDDFGNAAVGPSPQPKVPGQLPDIPDAVYDQSKARARWDWNPVRDYAAPLFQKVSRGMSGSGLAKTKDVEASGQIAAQNAAAKEVANQAAIREPLTDLVREWESLPPQVQTSVPLWHKLSDYVESKGSLTDLRYVDEAGNALEIPQDFAERFRQTIGPYAAQIELDAGMPFRNLDDPLGYMMRQAQNLGEQVDDYPNSPFRYGEIGSGNANQNARENIFRNTMTTEFNKMSLDEKIVGADLNKLHPANPKDYKNYVDYMVGEGKDYKSFDTWSKDTAQRRAGEYLLDNYNYQGFSRKEYDALSTEVPKLKNRAIIDPSVAEELATKTARLEELDKIKENATSLVDWHQTTVKDKYLKRQQETGEPFGFFTNNPMEMLGKRLGNAGKAAANAKAKTEALPAHLISGQPGLNQDLYSLEEAANALGFRGKDGVTEGFLKNIGELTGGAVSDPKAWSIPKDVVDNLARLSETLKGPQEIEGFWKAFDQTTSFFKTFALMRPAFHIRNMVGGQIQNAQQGVFSVYGLKGSRELMNGQTIKDLAKRIGFKGTDEEATKYIADLAFQHDVIPKYVGQVADLPGVINNQVLGAIPGSVPANASFDPRVAIKSLYTRGKEAWKNKKDGSLNPFKSRGVMEGDSQFFLSQANEQAGHIAEGFNRLTAWIAGLEQGMDPATLAAKIKEMHVDYGNLTQFERSVMRRVAPFYSFSRGMLPFTARQLAQNPGGPLGKTLRIMHELQGEGQILPDHISQTAAIPLGTNGEGDPRYLTGLGLMPEDSMTMFGSLAGAVTGKSGVGAELTGMINPLIKAPIEMATGRSLFQDRELKDMDPVLGRIKSNIFGGEPWQTQGFDTLAMNILPTPLTTIKQLTDTRKGPGAKALNAFTGVKITDVPEKTQEAMARGALQDLLRETGGQAYEKVFISKEELAKLPPEQQQKARAIQALLKELSERAKQRAKAKAE